MVKVSKDFYFGRNLDIDCSFGEQVVVTPRNFLLDFRNTGRAERHYAMIGMASADDRFLLYAEAERYLGEMRIVDTAFEEKMPPAPLHWMLADREKCLALEAVREGLKVYENPVGVLTNNLPFDYHRMSLNNYLGLSSGNPVGQSQSHN